MDQEQLEFLDDFIKDFNIKDADLKRKYKNSKF